MIENVIKRDGSIQPFNPEKLNRWAEYATEEGGDWAEIALETFKKLTDGCSTDDIHQTMIDVCIGKASLEYSRVAARLETAAVRKNMQYILGVDDNSPLNEIVEAYEDFGVWDSDTIPPFNSTWQKVYDEMKQERLEFWQVKQWNDKYASTVQDIVIETPQLGYLGIALALFGDTPKAYKYAKALCKGQINLPTPALNGLRNGDWDTISCCVLSAKDTVDSIGIANQLAYRMTAKKAGIGIEFTTRSKGDKVKGGRVKHLGKHPIFKTTDREVKTMTQITRGGNASVAVVAIDPEIQSILNWKSQKTDVETRIDKLDYNFCYNSAFVQSVKKDLDWYLFSLADAPELYTGACLYYLADSDSYLTYVEKLVSRGVKHTKIKARDLVKQYLTIRQETGRFYDTNVTRMNTHTPFLTTKGDVIRQSNLCLEIALPTHGFESLEDLVDANSKGEVAFCSLSALNYFKIDLSELAELAELTLEAVDIMIDKAPMLTASMKASIQRRRSVGVGITGLASRMYRDGFDYDGSSESLKYVRNIAEHHYFYLLKASQKLAKRDNISIEAINVDWLPIDTAVGESVSGLDWESLRGKPRKHSVLVAHMPTESSAMLSGASNGVYPVREKIVTKQSRKGFVQFICEPFKEGIHKTAWQTENTVLSLYYSAIQDSTDQAASCDFYEVPLNYENGKVPMSKLMKDFVRHAELGNKTRYYAVTKDSNGGSVQDLIAKQYDKANLSEQQEDGCEACKL